ncbi:hypothetical protein Bbelb_397280 [Branchiostoma belcheri]|nr:hypothetical protein Bbelb_397280 [Branchiostoma belcheri]
MKDSGIRSFGQWVTQHHWNEVKQAKTTQEKTSAFYRTLNAAVATHFPAKVIRLHVQDKPWISQKIKSAIRRRQRAFRDQDWETWRFLRNKIQKEIKRARSHYYNNRVQNLKKHSPSAWYKEIKVLTGTQKKGMTIQAQGVDPDSHRDMANLINQKFTNVTTSLPPLDRSKLPAYLPSRPPPVVHPWEVYWKLRRIKTNKSPGPDGIDGRLLKEFAYELSEPIVDILNSSLLEGTVPHEWKEAVVVPLPKTSPPSIDHLRPVSLTSLIGKICESFVASWVLQDIRPRICKDQFGCLKGRSTTHCLVNLANQLYKTADRRGSSSTWVLTDFSKAFDLVDHTVAIQHLLELGVTFQANLGWDSQVREMTRKGNQRLYLLCRLRQFNLPAEDLLTVYKSFVRPVVEYAAPVWHGGLTRDQRKKIENIQRRAAKIMLGRNYHGYSSACEVLHLQTLDDRRSTLCLKFAKKLLSSEEYRGWLPELRGDVSGRMNAGRTPRARVSKRDVYLLEPGTSVPRGDARVALWASGHAQEVEITRTATSNQLLNTIHNKFAGVGINLSGLISRECETRPETCIGLSGPTE